MQQNMVDNTAGGVKLLLESGLMLINHYDKQISGARSEVDGLKAEINSMIAHVRNHCNKDEKDEKFKEWVRQIGNVIRDVEDNITSAAAMKRSSIGHFAPVTKWFDSINGNGSQLVLDKRIGELRDRTRSAFQTAKNTLPKLPTATMSPTAVKKSAMQENLVIFEKEMDDIMKGLDSGKRQIFVIDGKSGSGKTTLARDIYKKAVLGDTFPILIWVDVSEEFNKQKVLRTILESLDADMITCRNDWQELVRNNLRVGNFLIFFDNVCTMDAWNEIRQLVPLESNKQGRVVITTRDEDLARNSAGRERYTLKSFDESERWNLLKLAVFGSRDCPPELLATGKAIVQCLDGVLLDIVVIGGVLREIFEKPGRQVLEVEREWRDISAKLRSSVQPQSISLSYNTLSYELKFCFRYLGIFSRDIKIPVRKVAQLWIAEGLIHHQEERSLEDIAQDYVHELVDKKLIIVENEKLDGGFKTCHLHDLVRHFCMSIANDRFQEIKVSSDGRLEPGFHTVRGYRRIFLHCSSSFKNFLQEKLKILSEEFREERLEVLKAHSVLAFCNEKCSLKEKEVLSISEGLNLLRVLDINMAINFQKFPAELTKLVLLKYVTLSGHDKFDVLPEDIYKLWNVQTLEVHTSSPTLEVKASSIWKMKQLRHFKTKASIILIKRRALIEYRNGARAGNNVLSTLKMLSPQSCTEEVFNEANNLKSLGIHGELGKLSCSLENLDHIENLKLVNDWSRAYVVAHNSWFPRNLKSLVLSGTKLELKHMVALGGIGTLEVLKLKNNEFVNDNCWDAGDGSFTSLKSLHISSKSLKTWNASGTAFRELEIIVLRQCESLVHIPEGLVMNLENLQLLHMDGVSKAAAMIGDRIKEIVRFEVIVRLPEGKYDYKIGSKGRW